MLKDSLYLTAPIDTIAYKTQMINNHFTYMDHEIGIHLTALWVVGLVYTLFIFKRPN